MNINFKKVYYIILYYIIYYLKTFFSKASFGIEARNVFNCNASFAFDEANIDVTDCSVLHGGIFRLYYYM